MLCGRSLANVSFQMLSIGCLLAIHMVGSSSQLNISVWSSEEGFNMLL